MKRRQQSHPAAHGFDALALAIEQQAGQVHPAPCALARTVSLLLRSLFGIGTAKPWLAAPWRAVLALISCFETPKEQVRIF